MKILLTGATGFLGSHLLKFWVLQGHEVIILKRSTSSLEKIIDYIDDIKIYNIDQIELVFQENLVDVVVHLATDYGRQRSLSDLVLLNVVFTFHCIELAKKFNVKLFINTDTFFNKGILIYKYLSEYTLTKRMVEMALPSYTNKSFRIFNLKLEHVYGPNDRSDKFVSQILEKLLKNVNKIELTEGTQKRDFIYVNDVVLAYDTVINNYNKLNKFEVIPVGTGKSVSIRQFIEELKVITQSQSDLLFGALPLRKGEFSDSFADCKKLQKLGWEPRYNIKEGIRELIKYY